MPEGITACPLLAGGRERPVLRTALRLFAATRALDNICGYLLFYAADGGIGSTPSPDVSSEFAGWFRLQMLLGRS